jgi:hypothetical protein
LNLLQYVIPLAATAIALRLLFFARAQRKFELAGAPA